MTEKYRDYGFRVPTITDEQYSFGDTRLGALAIKPDGDWEEFLPKYEPQADKYETFGCTVWGTENQIETLYKFYYRNEPDYSERYIYNIVGITPPGADPQLAYEAIRKNGLIEQVLLPLPDTYDEFCKPRPMSNEYLADGRDWLAQYDFGHDWVLTGGESQDARVKKLRAALQFSPVGVSVTAWFEENGVYVDNGLPNTHWCLLYKMDDKFYYVFDSYDHSKKILPHAHRIYYAKRITLSKKSLQRDNWAIDLLKRMLDLAKDILFKDLEIVKKNPEMPPVIPKPEPKPDYITGFCLAIKTYEDYVPPGGKYRDGTIAENGSRSWRNKNPGNCKFSSKGYLPIYGDVKKDPDNFAVFKDYFTGYLYLKNLVTQKFKENPKWTVLDFFSKFYAPDNDGNDSLKYAKFVAERVGLATSTPLEDLV